jgi:hypothetical protein
MGQGCCWWRADALPNLRALILCAPADERLLRAASRR